MIELVLIGAILILLFALYMGLFTKLQIIEDKFPGGFFVYYDYQGHINSANLFHQNLQKSLGLDTSNLTRMTITYDDPFNLVDPRSYRASLGFILTDFDQNKIDEFKKLHYEWTSLPQAKALHGVFPFRN